MEDVKKVIIIGSGPAGLTAAIYAARANLKPLVIEGLEAGGQLMTTTDVENYPGFENGITGPELMQVIRAQAKRFHTDFLTENVDKVDLSKKVFEVFVGNKKYLSHSLIISTGASAKYLGLESEKTFLGRGVSACATCDGAFFKDLSVCVVGGGDTAMEEALFLTRFAKKVFVLHRREKFRASKIMSDRVLNHDKIEVLWNSELKQIKGDKEVSSIEVFNNKENKTSSMEVQGVFIAIGHKPNTDFLNNQLKLNSLNYIETKDNSTKTSVAGVFACGDVQDSIYRQAITAAGTGCQAAIESEKYLDSLDL